ncbi:HutD/Ves family protein [Cupriavidus campinensis]
MSAMASGVVRFALDAIAPAPWKNGGGTTREIAVWPPGAGMDAFAWRVSVADIAADGPFSAFPGIDRQIVLLDGAGVHLQAHDDSFSHKLTRIGEPFAFPGDTAVHAALVEGATRDFNVMTRRGVCRADIALQREAFGADTGNDAVMVYVIRGEWRDAGGLTLRGGEGILVPAGVEAGRLALAPAEISALCLRVLLQMEPVQ